MTLELTDQIEQVMRARNRADKERAQLQKTTGRGKLHLG